MKTFFGYTWISFYAVALNVLIVIINTIFIFATNHICYSQDVPVVETPLGKVQGHYLISNGGNKYKAFEGIPFAEPPVNERRFKDPEPVESWPDLLIANKFKEPCVNARNLFSTGDKLTGVEDCLYLNIYVPSNIANKPLPVILYIYGGAFQFSTLLGKEQNYLIDHDIIFVTMNYRHGALGFLSTEDDVVSGNMGLKDQALVLQWISKYIEYFEGDPKQVAIFGFSSGGQSVHYHYLSPLTAGLFQIGVSFSGTAFSCIAQTENSRAKAIKLGELLGCSTDDIHKTVECLRQKPAYDIAAAQAYFQPWHFTEHTPFGPVVEKYSKKPFIDRSPIDIIRSGDVHPIPWITGVTSEDGLNPVAAFILNTTIMEDLNENWESIAPHLLDYYYTIPVTEHANVARKIRQHYFGSKLINKENSRILTNLVSHRKYTYSAVMAAKEQTRADRAPVWFYYYSYRPTNSFSNILSKSSENFGVCHGDDVALVLENKLISPTKSASDFAMHTELLKFWLSVVYNREPQFKPKWSKLKRKTLKLEYLEMSGPKNFKLATNDDLGELKFWETIDFNENKITPSLVEIQTSKMTCKRENGYEKYLARNNRNLL